jgi:hypothetical protein
VVLPDVSMNPMAVNCRGLLEVTGGRCSDKALSPQVRRLPAHGMRSSRPIQPSGATLDGLVHSTDWLTLRGGSIEQRTEICRIVFQEA